MKMNIEAIKAHELLARDASLLMSVKQIHMSRQATIPADNSNDY